MRSLVAWLALAWLTVAAGSIGCKAGGLVMPEVAKIYVASEHSGVVSVVRSSDFALVGSISLGEVRDGMPMDFMVHNVQAAPDGQTIWATAVMGAMYHGNGTGPDEVVVLDPHTDSIVARVEVGQGEHLAHVVLDEHSRFAYASGNQSNAIVEIDARAHAVTRRFELGANHGPHGMRYCAGRLFIANMTGMSLTILDPATSQMNELVLGGMAVQTACDPKGRYVFVSLADTREVVRYDLASGELIRIALPEAAEGPVQLYPAPDGSRLFVCDQGDLLGRPASNLLFEIDPAAAVVTGSIKVGMGAHGVVVSNDGQRAYVTNTVENTISTVDLARRQVIATTQVGTGPNGIAYWFVDGGMP